MIDTGGKIMKTENDVVFEVEMAVRRFGKFTAVTV